MAISFSILRYFDVGLCSLTYMDQTYTMVNGDINKKRYFSGNQGWKIYWDTLSSVSIFELILENPFHQ